MESRELLVEKSARHDEARIRGTVEQPGIGLLQPRPHERREWMVGPHGADMSAKEISDPRLVKVVLC